EVYHLYSPPERRPILLLRLRMIAISCCDFTRPFFMTSALKHLLSIFSLHASQIVKILPPMYKSNIFKTWSCLSPHSQHIASDFLLFLILIAILNLLTSSSNVQSRDAMCLFAHPFHNGNISYLQSFRKVPQN